jgi:hypothetical protein
MAQPKRLTLAQAQRRLRQIHCEMARIRRDHPGIRTPRPHRNGRHGRFANKIQKY